MAVNEPWTACEDPLCGECLQRQLRITGEDLDRAEAEIERLKADLQTAKDALFEIYIRPRSPDNADTAGRALEALAD